MSGLFAKIFGRNAKDNPPNPHEAAERITEIIDVMQKRQSFLEGKMDDCLARAKKYGMKNKRQALAALKEKKRFEKRLEQTDGIITTLEYQREALQNAQSNADVLNVMGFAVKALKNVHKNVDPDKVYNVIDDIAEQHEIAGEIATAISNPIGVVQELDDDELLQELEELEHAEFEQQMINVGPMPKPPVREPASVASNDLDSYRSKPSTAARRAERQTNINDDDDDDLKQLEMWAS